MTKAELKDALRYLGWSQAELARRVGYRPNSVSRWLTVPKPVAAYLRLYVAAKRLVETGGEG